MSAAAAVTFATLKKRVLSLGAANAFDYAMQFLLPVVLVRCLSPQAFGEYRLLWLLVMTVMVVVPLQMPGSLYFFLPRSDGPTRRLYVHQTLVYMACGGLLGALVVGPWNPLLPASVHALGTYGLLVPGVLALLAPSALLDTLPMADERVNWQAGITLALSSLRVLLLSWAAWLTGDLRAVVWMLLAVLAVKIGLLLGYVARAHGLGGAWFDRDAFRRQFSHAAPLGLAGVLYGLRAQGDQWIAASLFALGSFAAFSIAAVLMPMITLFRQSVNYVFLPSMSKLQAAGDLAGMIDLNTRANVMVGMLVYPLLAFAFFFADDIVSLVYTHAYVAAGPVMRVYIVGLAAFVVELSSVMLLLREGMFALRLNLAVLVGSVGASWFAAHHFGLAGAAVGSTLALYADRYATLRRIGAATGIALRELQDWPTLGRLLLISVCAGALAWIVARAWFAAAGVPLRLLVGGSVAAAVYGLLWLLTEKARGGSFASCVRP